MRKRLTQILTLLLFGSLSLSCMSANFGFHIHEDSRDQFVRVIQEAYITICTDEGCVRNPLKSSGSGVVVSSSNRGSYILTAAHVCELEPERIVPSPEYMDLVKQVEVNMSIIPVFLRMPRNQGFLIYYSYKKHVSPMKRVKTLNCSIYIIFNTKTYISISSTMGYTIKGFCLFNKR